MYCRSLSVHIIDLKTFIIKLFTYNILVCYKILLNNNKYGFDNIYNKWPCVRTTPWKIII